MYLKISNKFQPKFWTTHKKFFKNSKTKTIHKLRK